MAALRWLPSASARTRRAKRSRRGRVLLVEEGGRGGLADYTAELAAAIAHSGWRVHVATARDHAFPRLPGVEVHRRFSYVRGRGPLGRALRRLGLARMVNGMSHLVANLIVVGLARRCDVVHVQGGEWPPLTAVQALILRVAGRPVVHTAHQTFDRGSRSYPRAHAIVRRYAARIIVHSEHDRRRLPPAVRHKTIVIPHGDYGGLARGRTDVDLGAARAEIGAEDHEVVVLLFGHLRPDKGVRDLLLAAREIRAVRIVLAGADDGGLDSAADLLGDERLSARVVVRAGFVGLAEADQLFAAADVVALPYRYASASGVLLLAYAHRRPVLAYPVGGLPEYITDGVTGWLTARAEPVALVQTMRDVVAGGRPECRARGRAGRRLSDERYAWGPIAARTVALYDDVRSGQAG